jgi:hypothetical protein
MLMAGIWLLLMLSFVVFHNEGGLFVLILIGSMYMCVLALP